MQRTPVYSSNQEANTSRPSLQKKPKQNKRQKLWTRGENLTQAHPKQCPTTGKENLCNRPAASSYPESDNPKE